MAELVFECVRATAERYSAAPTLTLGLQVSETTGQQIGAIALRCQIRILPQRRRSPADEAPRLGDLFGEPSRWGDTLKPMQFAAVSTMVPAFRYRVEVGLPVPCSYDLEVAAGRYFDALDDGEIPLLLLFSGTVFGQGAVGLHVEQVPWHKECSFGLPVRTWREVIDAHFPNSGWLRLHRDTVAALGRFKSRRALPTWDATLEALLAAAGEEVPR